MAKVTIRRYSATRKIKTVLVDGEVTAVVGHGNGVALGVVDAEARFVNIHLDNATLAWIRQVAEAVPEPAKDPVAA